MAIKIVKYIITKSEIVFFFNYDSHSHNNYFYVESSGYAFIWFDDNIDKFIIKCYGVKSEFKKESWDSDDRIIENYLNSELFSDFIIRDLKTY